MATKLEALPKRLKDYRLKIVSDQERNENLYVQNYITKSLYIRKRRKYKLELQALDKVLDNLYNRINKIY